MVAMASLPPSRRNAIRMVGATAPLPNRRSLSMNAIRTIKKLFQAIVFLPVLMAFVIGSLPVLLPMALCRWIAGISPQPLRGST
jgi:hypothetical protein